MIFYTSDIHFRNKYVFEKCNRPFKNIYDFENSFITKRNSKVNKNDIIYVLGDLIGDDPEALKIYLKLNGIKHLIIGNHDQMYLKQIKKLNIFKTISFIKEIIDSEFKVCLCHYPLMDWINFNKDGILVYGHIHNKNIKNGIAYEQIKNYYSDKNYSR